MYGTRFKRRGALRPETTPGGRSRRRLLMRPAAYAVLAAAVCLAAATLPSQGKSDQAKAAAGPVGNGFTVTVTGALGRLWLVQPATVTRTVKVPLVVTVIAGVVAPLLQR